MASRQLTDLTPELQHKAIEFQARARERGVDALIYCTYRSNEEQDAEYAKGRTKPGRKVTNLRGGQSQHNHVNDQGKPASRAFDCVPVVNGKAQWDDTEAYKILGEIGRDLGMVWGGDWRMRDLPHFELP